MPEHLSIISFQASQLGPRFRQTTDEQSVFCDEGFHGGEGQAVGLALLAANSLSPNLFAIAGRVGIHLKTIAHINPQLIGDDCELTAEGIPKPVLRAARIISGMPIELGSWLELVRELRECCRGEIGCFIQCGSRR